MTVSAKMLRHFSIGFLSFWTACCSLALADEYTDKRLTESALQETRSILSRELLGHYDTVDLAVQKIEDLRNRISLNHDYGLVKVTLTFSTKRNTTKHPNLNREMFESGNVMCQGRLYLHCGVPVGHVFEGKLEILLAVDSEGSWRAVSPHCRSRRQYSLDGYLVLDGRKKEGYVLFPTQ